eukprot:3018502-Amphidinium_carterae.2
MIADPVVRKVAKKTCYGAHKQIHNKSCFLTTNCQKSKRYKKGWEVHCNLLCKQDSTKFLKSEDIRLVVSWMRKRHVPFESHKIAWQDAGANSEQTPGTRSIVVHTE